MSLETRQAQVKVAAPFSLPGTVLSHGWHECAPMSWCAGGRCFQVMERNGDAACRVSVVEGRRSARYVTLDVTIEGAALGETLVDRFLANLRISLGLDQDLTGFYALCRKHPRLRRLETIGAGRTLRSASMTENIIKAVCGTNVNWTQAVKMVNRLCQLGPNLPHFRNLNAWPTPREILRAGRPYLVDVCRLGYRADSILAFCREVSEGRFDPDELDRTAADPNVTTDDILARIRSIRGVGPTTAHYLLSFLGRHDRLAIDSSTVAHVSRTHLNGRRATAKQIEKLYAPYGPWKNKVWWFELWLGWATAEQMLADGKPLLERGDRVRGSSRGSQAKRRSRSVPLRSR